LRTIGTVARIAPRGSIGETLKQRKVPDRREQAKRAALNALKRARRAAALSGVKLSDWEGEFLGSVEGRVEKYGRAFGDPEKGAPGTSLSMRQTVKLKEIAGKAKGRKLGCRRRSGKP
jgi:hypothetical protein